MPLELVQCLDGKEGHSDRVWTLAWNPQGTILASSGGDKTIRLWALSNDKWVCVSILTETHSKSIRRLSWSPCGQYLASASFDSTVCIWRQNQNNKSWTTVVNLEGHENEVKSVAWSSDGHYLASCGRDRTVWIWERANPDQEDLDDDVENWDCSDVKNDHTKDVKHIVWHPSHNILVSTSYDDTVKFFHKEGDDWTCFETLTSHTSTVWSADFSSSGEFLVTSSDDRTVRVWKNHSHHLLPEVKSNSWKCVSVVQGYHSRTIYDVAWCKNNDNIVSVSGDNSIVIYSRSSQSMNEDTFVCVDKLSGAHECDVNNVKWNPKSSEILATGSDDSTIKIWKYTSDGKGRIQPLTIKEEILKDISNADNAMNITDFSNLLNLTQSFQTLQNEMWSESDNTLLITNHKIEKLLDLKILENNQQPVELSDLKFDETDNSIKEFNVKISSNDNDIRYSVKLVITPDSNFKLFLPKRSTKLLKVATELFVLDKTGDLSKILPSGKTEFLLGHLFMFSDVKFALSEDRSKILYIISADRDEKIRITNYPKTFLIERFCFGHKYFVKRILLANDQKFISIDQQNNLIVWNLTRLTSDKYSPLKPEVVISLDENPTKRLCLNPNMYSEKESSGYEINNKTQVSH